MANLKKFLNEEKKQQRTKVKSFRLSTNAYSAIETLAAKTGKSQNEIVNEIFEDYEIELSFINNLEKLFIKLVKNEKKIVLRKITAVNDFADRELVYLYEILKDNDNQFVMNYKILEVQYPETKMVAHTITKTLLDSKLNIADLTRLLDFGVDSAFEVNVYEIDEDEYI